MNHSGTKQQVLGALMAGALAASLLAAGPARASSPGSRPIGDLTIRSFATGTGTRSQPDDMTRLGGRIFVAWQNGVGADGTPNPTNGVATSDVIEYAPNGAQLNDWSIPGHVDGLTADPAARRVVVTSNEDADSALYTITPSLPAVQQVESYAFSPTPLPHGGGTDAISIFHGRILVSASNPPGGTDVPAVYIASLANGTATLTPLFSDTAAATQANTGPGFGSPVTLALTDPDSNEVVPEASPRFSGDFVLDSQGDLQQIYTGGTLADPELSALNLSQSVDDTAFLTSTHGVLYASDSHADAVYAITGDFQPGAAIVAVTPGNANSAPPNPGPNYLGTLNLWTGAISPLATTVQPKGLLFAPGQDQQ